MRHLPIFKEWHDDRPSDKFYLVAVRHFLGVCHDDENGIHRGGISETGEYCTRDHPLPKLYEVVAALKQADLELAVFPLLECFHDEQERLFRSNFIYGLSNSRHSFSFINPHGKETTLYGNFSFGKARQSLRARMSTDSTLSYGYNGEMCFLCVPRGQTAEMLSRRMTRRKGQNKDHRFREE